MLKQVSHDEDVAVLGCQVKRCVSVHLGYFVRVLSLADQNAHHVEVTLPGGLPDDSEPKLRLRVLANVKGDLVLRVAGVTQLGISVSFPRQQLFDHFGETIVSSIMQWSPLSGILCIDICPKGQQKSHSFEGALLTRQMQRRTLLSVSKLQNVKSTLVLIQESDQLIVVLHGCEVQRCSLLVRKGTNFGTLLDE